jgi:hypothetical protein
MQSDGRTVAQVTEKGVEEVSTVKWTIGMAVLAICAYPATAQESIQTAFNYNLADCACEEPSCDVGQSSCCCEEPACCCEEPSCGCDNGCCDNCGCGGGGSSLFGDCCLGDPCVLQEELQPCCDRTHAYGGWASFGYYTDNERLSADDGDEFAFNDFPDHLNLDQAWLYFEKVAEADDCSADWGYRYDIMYGAQAHAAQSYGNPRALDGPNLGAWDASLDHGVYGWAMPQAYGEVAFGDWSVKAGHWFTPVGYEVIPANGNFFYSHTLTHYNSEPFTHTGVLGTYSASDKVALSTGWALGWDTGFEQFDGGNIFVGGVTYTPSDDVTLIYMVTAGNLGWKSGGEEGFSHHFVGIADISENTQWVLQHDYLKTNGVLGDDDFEDEDKGLTNYLFYTLNDCWKLGARVEWWRTNILTGNQASFYDMTYGLNYWAHANVVVRPEIRYDWTPSDEAVDSVIEDYNQLSFSIDCVMTY